MAEQLQHTSNLRIFKLNELDNVSQNLCQMAIENADKAYAPYSNFKVGSAALLSSGNIIGGSNQENGAFPSGMCAERIAAYSAKAQFPEEDILQIAIFTISAPKNSMPSPCGNCRQVLHEIELKQKRPISLLLGVSKEKIYHSESISNLIPFPFVLSKD